MRGPGNRGGTCNGPAGDQTAFGYGYLAPPPYTNAQRQQMRGERPQDRGPQTDHEFVVVEVSGRGPDDPGAVTRISALEGTWR